MMLTAVMLDSARQVHTGKLFIVVVPFHALLEDLNRRAVQALVQTAIWTRELPATARTGLLFVSCNSAVTREFLAWVNLVKGAGAVLEACVFDEAHVPSTALAYRQEMRSLHLLRHLEARLVFLTATAPPGSLHDLHSVFGATSITVYRDYSDRPELAYKVSCIQHLFIWPSLQPSLPHQLLCILTFFQALALRGGFPDGLAELLTPLLDELAWEGGGGAAACTDDRMIIFTLTRAHAEQTAGLVRDLMLISGRSGDRVLLHMASSDDREANLTAFNEQGGGPLVVVATSCFGTGISHPAVRSVVCLGPA